MYKFAENEKEGSRSPNVIVHQRQVAKLQKEKNWVHQNNMELQSSQAESGRARESNAEGVHTVNDESNSVMPQQIIQEVGSDTDIQETASVKNNEEDHTSRFESPGNAVANNQVETDLDDGFTVVSKKKKAARGGRIKENSYDLGCFVWAASQWLPHGSFQEVQVQIPTWNAAEICIR